MPKNYSKTGCQKIEPDLGFRTENRISRYWLTSLLHVFSKTEFQDMVQDMVQQPPPQQITPLGSVYWQFGIWYLSQLEQNVINNKHYSDKYESPL